MLVSDVCMSDRNALLNCCLLCTYTWLCMLMVVWNRLMCMIISCCYACNFRDRFNWLCFRTVCVCACQSRCGHDDEWSECVLHHVLDDLRPISSVIVMHVPTCVYVCRRVLRYVPDGVSCLILIVDVSDSVAWDSLVSVFLLHNRVMLQCGLYPVNVCMYYHALPVLARMLRYTRMCAYCCAADDMCINNITIVLYVLASSSASVWLRV